jgi:hypothetical protein
MAVGRQQNLQGQIRLDIPMVRSIESGVSYDFDVLAGQMMTGGLPQVIKGFKFVEAGALGKDAEALVLQVAASSLIHFRATEAGSIFRVPVDRASETLSPTNPRVQGSFTPGATNFVGIDLVRRVDDATADTAQFLIPTTNKEKARVIPMGRTMDYRIVVSTTEFSATPGIAPIAKVVTDASNKVVSLEDARELMYRLARGGSSPSAVSPYGWPGGRNESVVAQASVGGDRSITDLKQWLNAMMTKVWELGGGEYWYSLTGDRNVHMNASASFASTLEGFEVVASNLHWQKLIFTFDNSTGVKNEVAEQLTDSTGLTDLADGECLYVDLDRTQDRTVVGTNALTAQRTTIRSLGGSARPGNRWIFAWRIGSDFYVVGQVWPVGQTFRAASTSIRGVVKLTADSLAIAEIADPRVANVVDCTNVSGSQYFATVEGISHNADKTANGLWGVGTHQIQIGRGTAAGDGQILLKTDGNFGTVVSAAVDWSADADAAVYIDNQDTANAIRPDNKTLVLAGDDGGTTHVDAHYFEVGGAIGFRNVPQTPETPNPGAPRHRIRSKLFFTTNGLASPFTKDQFCVMWWNGLVEVIKESPAY